MNGWIAWIDAQMDNQLMDGSIIEDRKRVMGYDRERTLPSPRPLMTLPRVSKLLLMALPSVCLSLLSPSSFAASVLRSLPARSTKFSVDTCRRGMMVLIARGQHAVFHLSVRLTENVCTIVINISKALSSQDKLIACVVDSTKIAMQQNHKQNVVKC